MVYHLVNKKQFKEENYERTLCGLNMWDCAISFDENDFECKNCRKKLKETLR